ncbi:hypothetical protein N9L68_06390 [bacterium]|nr:hypothetical protein [bacterium]
MARLVRGDGWAEVHLHGLWVHAADGDGVDCPSDHGEEAAYPLMKLPEALRRLWLAWEWREDHQLDLNPFFSNVNPTG